MGKILSNWLGGTTSDSPRLNSSEATLSVGRRKKFAKPRGNIHILTIPMRRSDGEVWCVERPDGRWNVNTNAGTKTSRKTQADAETFCVAARLDPSLLLPKTKGTTAARPSRHAPYQQPPATGTSCWLHISVAKTSCRAEASCP